MTFIEVLAEQNLYTFDDQIVFALAILRTNPDILREYQRYFEHIIIDELQDFSPAKVELLMMLCERHANIMAFGDIFQEVQFDTIRTQGEGSSENVKIPAQAAFARLAQRDRCHLGKAHQLTINFRSTQEILDFATFIRSKVNGGTAVQLRSGQNKHGPKPTYLYTRYKFADRNGRCHIKTDPTVISFRERECCSHLWRQKDAPSGSKPLEGT